MAKAGQDVIDKIRSVYSAAREFASHYKCGNSYLNLK